MITQKGGIGENWQEGVLREMMERESRHCWRRQQNEASATAFVAATAFLLAITVGTGQQHSEKSGLSEKSGRPEKMERAEIMARPEQRGPEALSRLDLNLASQAELQAVPQIGPGLAARIVAVRQQQGPYQSVDDLRQVPGLGAGRVARLRPFFTVGEYNSSDRKDIQAKRWAVSTASALSASRRSTPSDRAVGSRSP